MAGMTVAVVIATYGDQDWADLARNCALPTADLEKPDELYLIHDRIGSLARARNEGARRARSSHLVFLDADDELAPGYVRALRDAYSVLTIPLKGESEVAPFRTKPSLLVPRVQFISEDGDEGRPLFPNRHLPMEDLNHCVIGTAVPRLLFQAVGGFRDDLPIYEDWALFLACKRAGARLVDVPGAIYRAHAHADSRNNDREVALETYRRIRAEHMAALDE